MGVFWGSLVFPLFGFQWLQESALAAPNVGERRIYGALSLTGAGLAVFSLAWHWTAT